eukprot:TRINITY_DN833_c0_g1_i3.p2 TRINITY_DN833_c0_g1~~TRINITY_DN833_c0_g1_i3.p2  ORF type:complete len:336 (-),score=61.33 TRINITY_DN833_c0_g1_i3:187-1161(-)
MADPQEASKRTLYVTQISPDVSEENLKQFFGFCGTIVGITILPGNTDTKSCFVQFSKKGEADTGLLLTDTPLLGRQIKVVSAAGLDLASITAGAITANTGAAATSAHTLQQTANVLASISQPSFVVKPIAQQLSTDLYINSNVVPKQAPVQTAQSIADEVARTVYVGNLNPMVSAQEIMDFFAPCGNLTYVRMRTQGEQQDRFAFVEFETQEASAAAMRMSGGILLDRSIRVNRCNNPIVKPPPPKENLRETERTQRHLQRIAEMLTRKVLAAEGKDADGRGDRRRSRSRSPHRRSGGSSRGDRRRSRSRSPRERERRRSRSPR